MSEVETVHSDSSILKLCRSDTGNSVECKTVMVNSAGNATLVGVDPRATLKRGAVNPMLGSALLTSLNKLVSSMEDAPPPAKRMSLRPSSPVGVGMVKRENNNHPLILEDASPPLLDDSGTGGLNGSSASSSCSSGIKDPSLSDSSLPIREGPDPDGIKMFVGQVPKSMDEKDLRKMFEEFGEVFQINVLRDKVTKQSKGCCFVTFFTRKSALEAQNALHNIKTLPGMHHPIQMKPADTENRNERKLFIGMLSKKLNEADVRQMFASYGQIEECTVLRDANAVSRGCAFVTFTTRQSAISAIKGMHHSTTMEGCSSPMVVKFADTQKEKDQKRVVQTPSLPPVLSTPTPTTFWPAPAPAPAPNPGNAAVLNPQYLALLQHMSSNSSPSVHHPHPAAAPPSAPSNGGVVGGGGVAHLNGLHLQQLLAMAQHHVATAQHQHHGAAAMPSSAGLSALLSAPSQSDLSSLQSLAALANMAASSPTQNGAGNALQSLAALAALSSVANGGSGGGGGSPASVSSCPVSVSSPPSQPPVSVAVSSPSAGTAYQSVAGSLLLNGLGSVSPTDLYGAASDLHHQSQTQHHHQATLAAAFPGAVFTTSTQNATPAAYATPNGLVPPAMNGAAAMLNSAAAAAQAMVASQVAQLKQLEGPDGANLFIYHLPQDFSDGDLAQSFLPFGNVISAKVFIDKQTNLSKCFGFVSFDNSSSAVAAINAMNGFQVGTKRLKVQLKRGKDTKAF